MIQRLQDGIGSRGLFALVGGENRVAAHLFGATLHYPHQETLAPGHGVVVGGVPVVAAGYQVFRDGDRALDTKVVVEQIAGDRAGGGDAGPGQEVATC